MNKKPLAVILATVSLLPISFTIAEVPSKQTDKQIPVTSLRVDPKTYTVRGTARLGKYGDEKFIGWWREDGIVTIPLTVTNTTNKKDPTLYTLQARVAAATSGGDVIQLSLSNHKDPHQQALKTWTAPIAPTGGWGKYADASLGMVSLSKAGHYYLHCFPKKMNQDFINMGSVIFSPTGPVHFTIQGKKIFKKKFGEGQGNTLEAKVQTVEQQLAGFSVPEGFVIENVSHEGLGTIKPISLSFDDAGRLWTQTASEYPKDRNPTAFDKKGKDKILVFDHPHHSQPQRPRVFADGLVMPISVLPHNNGVHMILGSKIFFLQDTNKDGKADKRTLLMSGLGVKDSHTCAHHLTRTPGNWIVFSQGVHATGTVHTRDGKKIPFYQALMGRFKPDGTNLEIIGEGMNNIWAWSINKEGRTYIHEANDLGYSQAAFERDATYPSFLPTASRNPLMHPPTAPDLGLDGTGFCGIATGGESPRDFPKEWQNKNFVANPITGEINTVSYTIDELGNHTFKREQDLVTCSDPMFRPVNVSFGPDGCLYIIDWYNRTISHGTTTRNLDKHDTTSGRIWRVRHKSQKPYTPVNIEDSPNKKLLQHLKSKNLWEMRAAWHQIEKRQAKDLLPQLKDTITDSSSTDSIRIHALWSIESLNHFDADLWKYLLSSKNQHVRYEALRALSTIQPPLDEVFPLVRPLAKEKSYYVLNELVRFFRDTPQTKQPAHLEFLQSFFTEKSSLPQTKVKGWRHQYYPLGGSYEKRFLNQLIESIDKKRTRTPVIDEKKWGKTLTTHPAQSLKQSAKLNEKVKHLAKLFRTSKQANLAKGKTHFDTRCAICHGNNGFAPPINRGKGINPEELLTAILKPNDAIEDIFRSYRIIKKDGTSLEGFRSNITGDSITLSFMGGGKITVLHKDIREAGYIEGKSMMPEGMIGGLSDQDVIDLISFLTTTEK